MMLSDRNIEGSCHWGVWLLYDNARVHKSVVAQQAIRDCEFLQLSNPEYSQDLGASNYFLFRNPKFRLCGTQFTDVQSPKIVVEAWFDRQDKKVVFQGVNSLDEKQKICPDVAGEYGEK